MEQWKEDLLHFGKSKFYGILLLMSAIGGYGYLVTHATVGIDDTPYAYYFEEGLVAIVGRWVLFVLNKFLRFSDFTPFLTDLCGVIFLLGGAVVFSVYFYRILGEKVPMWGYAFFAAFLVANPLHSEVFTYYLHNGVGLGFLCSGLSLSLFRQGFKDRKKIGSLVGSVLLLWVSMGCYESFMILWIVGLLLGMIASRYVGGGEKVLPMLMSGAGICVLGMLLRTLMIPIVTAVFGLKDLQGEAVQRSLKEMLAWVFDSEAREGFVMACKRAFVMYGAFSYAYLPVALFVLACFLLFLAAVVVCIRKKEAWCLVLTVGCYIACFLLICIEGKVTLYRSAQFLPLVCAFGCLIFAMVIAQFGTGKLRNVCRGLAIVVLGCLLFRQCFELNRWFYVDELKYEDAKNTVNRIAYELEKSFDTEKPVVFTGTYQIPKSLIEKAYVPYGSKTFYRINRLTTMVDAHLLEKFYRGEYGVWVAQTPSLSVLDWGRYAFDTDEELVRFFAMHGHKIKALTDTSLYEEAENFSLELPEFPKEGSIVDRGEYIIVHF